VVIVLTPEQVFGVRIPSGQRADGILTFAINGYELIVYNLDTSENPISRASDPSESLLGKLGNLGFLGNRWVCSGQRNGTRGKRWFP